MHMYFSGATFLGHTATYCFLRWLLTLSCCDNLTKVYGGMQV